MKKLFSRISAVHVFAALLVLILIIWVVTCVREGKPDTPTRTTPTAPPPPTISNVPTSAEQRAQQQVDSLNALRP